MMQHGMLADLCGGEYIVTACKHLREGSGLGYFLSDPLPYTPYVIASCEKCHDAAEGNHRLTVDPDNPIEFRVTGRDCLRRHVRLP